MRATLKIFHPRERLYVDPFSSSPKLTRLPRTPLPCPIVHPGSGQLPVVLAVAHAGRDYPDWLIAEARGGRSALESLEDPLVDELIQPALGDGFAVIVARTPRAAIDCNRAEDDIDPTVVRGAGTVRPSARARGGLGIVPGRTAAQGALWRQPLDRRELERRLEEAHRPFHDSVAAALAQLYDRYGCALLLDCHSMPPPNGGPAVVFGDRHGRTAAGWLSTEALRIARSCGFGAGLNDPFAGGHTIERHAAPERGIHALQIEIDRRSYLAPDGRSLDSRAHKSAELIRRLANSLGSALLSRTLPAAAE